MRESGETIEWMRPLGLVIGSYGSPLAATYLPLEDAMTVLYGLNGAGKSFVVDALRCSLSGVVPERLRNCTIWLLAELPEELDRWPVGLARAFESVTANPLAAYGLHEELEIQLRFGWERMWQSGYHDSFGMKNQLASEFARSGVFLVRPRGIEVPTWELRPALIPSAQTPASDAFLQRVRTLDDEDAVSLSPVYELWSGWAQPPTAPTILYSEAFGVTVSASAGTPVRLWDDPIEEEDLDIDLVTAEALQALISERDSRAVMADLAERVGVGSRPVPELSLDSLMGDLQARANEYFAALLRDAPALDLELRPSVEWLSQPALRWLARRLESDDPIPIRWLSHAERRWATLAIRMALSGSPSPLLILDEPEAALHRTAEAHMAAALADMSARATARFVLSTHSPELLDSRGAMRVLVRRRTPALRGELVPFTGAALEAMDELGLQPSDLLRRTRGYLLVEGEHDIAVLRGWFDDDFTDLGVQVLPLRGGSKLRTVLDSRFLFDYTDALLFPFLDDIDAKRVQSAWENAIKARKTKQPSEVIDALLADLRTVGSKGLEYMVPFLTRALERGRENRVLPLGIRRTDIIDYLPIERFVPTAASWDDLRSELRDAKGGVDASETEFKAWLRKKYDVDLSPEAVAEVARRSDPAAEIRLLIDQLKTRLSG